MLGGRIPAWPLAAHATAFTWGVLGGAVQGFLLTAYPRQNDAPPPGPRTIAAAVGLHAWVWALVLAGWSAAPTGLAATLLGLVSWGGLAGWSARIAWTSLRRKWDGTTFAVPLTLVAATVGWGLVRADHAALGEAVGLHLFLLPLALAVLDRVLPFFSSRVVPGYDGVRRPHFAAALFGLGLAHLLTPWADWVTAALLLHQWTGWRLRLRVPMIAVLHLGVAWVFAGLLLGPVGPGRLATHLLGLGGLGTLVFGISMRVTLGHGGRAIELSRVGASALGLLQLGVVLRTAGLWWPAALPWAGAATAAAFLAWIVGFAKLALR